MWTWKRDRVSDGVTTLDILFGPIGGMSDGKKRSVEKSGMLVRM